MTNLAQMSGCELKQPSLIEQHRDIDDVRKSSRTSNYLQPDSCFAQLLSRLLQRWLTCAEVIVEFIPGEFTAEHS